MAKPRRNKDGRKWYQKLRNKYRLVILNDETYEERVSFRLSRMNVFVTLGTLSIVLIVLTAVIIAFTGLREYIPGYMDPEIPKKVYKNRLKLDSLEQLLQQQTLKFYAMKNIIDGGDFEDTITLNMQDAYNYDTITLENSKRDSVFRSEYEKQTRFNLNLYEDSNPFEYTAPSNINFFVPLSGNISSHFNLAIQHYGIDIVSGSNETVKSVMDGTVIISDWTLETGYVLGIQHPGNYISIYKHNSSLLKRIGSHVRAGEPIAIVGETGELSTGPHLHFELWHNGTPVNPLDYIAF
ncbi:MAG: M23 family metallopeptidase [Bacteroidales bacterium]|nr:M23 family metallopeptidase [Bacteroidales bacterium]MCF8345091.1 M23 family metallopeptidase [Bacteroidales bacterium]MCF8351565.1 M23 family metallopeptidase [Bacteroidales bacterium]MCF8376457.1 M23 family metallopeptidase [Bacteroidales bacterium]MCF8400576.1 M23 family metallopeptidase [Bacteroidales bacterium]